MPYTTVFELSEAACELHNKNDRLEKHGPNEEVLAMDLNFTYETNNSVLAMFSPSLRGCLYMADQPAEGALALSDDNLSKLRNPALGQGKKGFDWLVGELVGATLIFHKGIDEKSEIAFDEVKIGKYKLECREGGTVVVHFQAQLHPTTDKQMAFLSKALVNKICTLSITPPSA